MPVKEITTLRKAGKLDEALEMALAELGSQPESFWAKRNISWVYCDMVKQNCSPEKFDVFSQNIDKIVQIGLPEDETVLFENVAWQIVKMGFALLGQGNANPENLESLFLLVKEIHLSKPSEVYSALCKVFHKMYKDHALWYINFVDWWDLKNFRPNDYQKEVLPNGKSLMSLAEQVYIAYARNLLPRQMPDGGKTIDRDRVIQFLPVLDNIITLHPEYQYPPYFKAKLLLGLGERDVFLSSFLPFALKKKNEFWIWDVLSEAFPDDEDKALACYAKALLCVTREEMLVSVRQKITEIFVKRQMWDDAKTEIEKIVEIRFKFNWKIPKQIVDWQNQPWFADAKDKQNINEVYRTYAPLAEAILYEDLPEETAIVTFVNKTKGMLNFIVSETKFGFLMYDRFLKSVNVGETLKIKFLKKGSNGLFQVATLRKCDNQAFRKGFVKEFQGMVQMKEGSNFGFTDNVFLSPAMCEKNSITNGSWVSGNAVKTFDERKNQWGWRAYEIRVK